MHFQKKNGRLAVSTRYDSSSPSKQAIEKILSNMDRFNIEETFLQVWTCLPDMERNEEWRNLVADCIFEQALNGDTENAKACAALFFRLAKEESCPTFNEHENDFNRFLPMVQSKIDERIEDYSEWRHQMVDRIRRMEGDLGDSFNMQHLMPILAFYSETGRFCGLIQTSISFSTFVVAACTLTLYPHHYALRGCFECFLRVQRDAEAASIDNSTGLKCLIHGEEFQVTPKYYLQREEHEALIILIKGLAPRIDAIIPYKNLIKGIFVDDVDEGLDLLGYRDEYKKIISWMEREFKGHCERTLLGKTALSRIVAAIPILDEGKYVDYHHLAVMMRFTKRMGPVIESIFIPQTASAEKSTTVKFPTHHIRQVEGLQFAEEFIYFLQLQILLYSRLDQWDEWRDGRWEKRRVTGMPEKRFRPRMISCTDSGLGQILSNAFSPDGIKVQFKRPGPENQFLKIAMKPLLGQHKTFEICSFCGLTKRGTARSVCSGCNSAQYHDKECQMRHWALSHKHVCKSTPEIAVLQSFNPQKSFSVFSPNSNFKHNDFALSSYRAMKYFRAVSSSSASKIQVRARTFLFNLERARKSTKIQTWARAVILKNRFALQKQGVATLQNFARRIVGWNSFWRKKMLFEIGSNRLLLPLIQEVIVYELEAKFASGRVKIQPSFGKSWLGLRQAHEFVAQSNELNAIIDATLDLSKDASLEKDGLQNDDSFDLSTIARSKSKRANASKAPSVMKIEYTPFFERWLSKQKDERQREMVFKRLRQLAAGDRSYCLSKPLKGSKTQLIVETKIDKGNRIVWTQKDADSIQIWFVCKHKHISRCRELVDMSYQRVEARLQDVETEPPSLEVLVEPLENVPLKIRSICVSDLSKLESEKGWRPPFKLTEHEEDIVRKQGTVLLLGRSGTGKTLCVCNRIFRDAALLGGQTRMLFIGRTQRLCNYIQRICEGNGGTAGSVEFKTAREFVLELYASITGNGNRRVLVDFSAFSESLWKEVKGGEKDLDALEVWTQIRSFIKVRGPV